MVTAKVTRELGGTSQKWDLVLEEVGGVIATLRDEAGRIRLRTYGKNRDRAVRSIHAAIAIGTLGCTGGNALYTFDRYPSEF